jgi:NAD(P)-dependent dehydrogenase (short-subunit alcohol dehydrogenase family)
VTGASRGIGAATALALARRGFVVACTARPSGAPTKHASHTVEDVVERIRGEGGEAIRVAVDLSARLQVVEMVDRTVAELGRLDVLVNNAAAYAAGSWDMPLHDHDMVMAVNFDAPFVASRQAIPHLLEGGGGRIVNVSSLAALVPFPGLAAMSYAISKIALERLTRELAAQLRGEPIAVNCLRVDVGVASEAARAVMPDRDFRGSAIPETVAEGLVWMLDQDLDYTGRLESLRHLAVREGIMSPVAIRSDPLPPTTFG